ncbi:hypothetical protein [Pseudopedobacter sp.]|uniref:hypothetical protein n=1 Tax=Pseudopedobacter sp. TaxID=1936787 RepID=UPI00333F15F9
MKKLGLIFGILFSSIALWACPVCEKQQPKVLKGITHGVGPQNNWDYVIISIVAVLVLITLFYTVKYLIKPGEKSASHIKNLFIN